MIETNNDGILSSIGSPNFNSRSDNRDNELQFYIFSRNHAFNSRLKLVIKSRQQYFYLIFSPLINYL